MKIKFENKRKEEQLSKIGPGGVFMRDGKLHIAISTDSACDDVCEEYDDGCSTNKLPSCSPDDGEFVCIGENDKVFALRGKEWLL